MAIADAACAELLVKLQRGHGHCSHAAILGSGQHLKPNADELVEAGPVHRGTHAATAARGTMRRATPRRQRGHSRTSMTRPVRRVEANWAHTAQTVVRAFRGVVLFLMPG
jgi:hypothetical protein